MNEPFDMLIVGMIACGKTKYLIDMLEKDYKHICPTFRYNKTYQEWKYKHDPDFLAIQCDQDQVNIILEHVSDVYKGINSLVIIDHCASFQQVNIEFHSYTQIGI